MHKLFILVATLSLFASQPSLADNVASNISRITTDKYGRCYAKAIPDEPYGEKGTTKIYHVETDKDELAVTFPWYATHGIYLQCNACGDTGPCGISTVRMGQWPNGHEANKKDMAIAFYLNDKLLKEYSTLDIAKDPKNVMASASHYSVFKNIVGYSVTQSNYVFTDENTFTVETYDGRRLKFALATGKLLSESK